MDPREPHSQRGTEKRDEEGVVTLRLQAEELWGPENGSEIVGSYVRSRRCTYETGLFEILTSDVGRRGNEAVVCESVVTVE